MNIKVCNVSKSFDKKSVLRNISMQMHAGEILCLLGPSGSGKTTLIRLILGALEADGGEIFVGKTKMPSLKVLKSIGFMPQNDALYDDLNAEDNLRFFAGLYKIGQGGLEHEISEKLELVNLSEDRKKLVRNFSGGMKKRLSLAIALIHSPDIFLLDEPTVGIDPVLRRSIWQRFIKLKEEGKTIIITTHVMDEVSECDRAALIYNGELIEFDTVSALLAKTQSGRIEDLFFEAGNKDGGIA